MAFFKLYAGLGGSFGGARFKGTFEFDSKEEALNTAYEMAIEEYQSYEGYYGILNEIEVRENLINSYGEEEVDEEDVQEYYLNEIENWISYYVREAASEHDVDDE